MKYLKTTLAVALMAAVLLGPVARASGAETDQPQPAINAQEIEQMLVAGGLNSYRKMAENVWQFSFGGAVRPWDIYVVLSPTNLRITTRLIRIPSDTQETTNLLLKLLDHPRRYTDLKVYVADHAVWAAHDRPPAGLDGQVLRRVILGLANWGEQNFLELVRGIPTSPAASGPVGSAPGR